MLRWAGVIMVLAVAQAALADDVIEPYVVVRHEKLQQPVVAGQYLAYYAGREGRFIYDLAARKQVEHMRQWRTVPHGINERYVMGTSGDGIMLLYDLRRQQTMRRNMRKVGDVAAISLGGGWFAAVTERHDRDTHEKYHVLRAYEMGGRARSRYLSRYMEDQRFVAAERHVTWFEPRVGAAGIYLFKYGDEKEERVVEVKAATSIDTDGQRIVWITDQRVKMYDIATKETTDPLEAETDETARMVRLAGDWVVWADADWQLHARHISQDRALDLTNVDQHAGLNELADASEGFVVWANKDVLWAYPLPESK